MLELIAFGPDLFNILGPKAIRSNMLLHSSHDDVEACIHHTQATPLAPYQLGEDSFYDFAADMDIHHWSSTSLHQFQ